MYTVQFFGTVSGCQNLVLIVHNDLHLWLFCFRTPM